MDFRDCLGTNVPSEKNAMNNSQNKTRWNPADFLEFWTDENVDQQPANLKIADQLAKKFMADAAVQGFVLAQFMFNEASLSRYIAQAMTTPRV